jgi:Holliday junction resolvase
MYPKFKKEVELMDQLKKESIKLKQVVEKKDDLYRNLETFSNTSIMKITSLYSNFITLQDSISAELLERKRHPAYIEAKRIKEVRAEKRMYIERYNIMLYKYEALLSLFPELLDYVDDFDSLKELESLRNIDSLKESYDYVKDYLSKEEYSKLSEDDRNQIALNRYVKGQKSNWRIGRDYEMYVGYYLRERGYSVLHYGIEKKYDDLGCDIIAIKNNEVLIIQCKNWKEKREIHEKYIFQLYGTYILLKLNYKNIIGVDLLNKNILPYFISTYPVTDRAKEIARFLNVGILVVPIENYPRIKCNIGKDTNGNDTKIYHLPFDQQYDRVKIDKSSEFYAWTVKEATLKGFRRAYKYYGLHTVN